RSRGTSSRLDKWFSKLEADYVFTLTSVKGTDNVVADCLSRDGEGGKTAVAAAPAIAFSVNSYKKKKKKKNKGKATGEELEGPPTVDTQAELVRRNANTNGRRSR